MFEYEAGQDDELDLKVGDIITDVQTVSTCLYSLIWAIVILPVCVCCVDVCRWMKDGVRECSMGKEECSLITLSSFENPQNHHKPKSMKLMVEGEPLQ